MQDIYSVAINKILRKKIPLLGRIIGWYYFFLEKRCEYNSDKIVVIASDFKKFIDKKIFPPGFAIVAVHVPTYPGVGRHDDHRRGVATGNDPIGNVVGFTELHPAGFVVGIAVKKVQNRVASVGSFVIERKVHRVFDILAEGGAFHFQAFL